MVQKGSICLEHAKQTPSRMGCGQDSVGHKGLCIKEDRLHMEANRHQKPPWQEQPSGVCTCGFLHPFLYRKVSSSKPERKVKSGSRRHRCAPTVHPRTAIHTVSRTRGRPFNTNYNWKSHVIYDVPSHALHTSGKWQLAIPTRCPCFSALCFLDKAVLPWSGRWVTPQEAHSVFSQSFSPFCDCQVKNARRLYQSLSLPRCSCSQVSNSKHVPAVRPHGVTKWKHR